MEKKTPKNNSDVGYVMDEHIKAKQNDGRVNDTTIGAASQQEGETKLIIDYGHEETATIELAERFLFCSFRVRNRNKLQLTARQHENRPKTCP